MFRDYVDRVKMDLMFKNYQRLKIRGKYGRHAADPWEKIYVDPAKVTDYYTNGIGSVSEYWKIGGYWSDEFDADIHPWLDAGEIRAGDWDQHTLDLTELPKYVGAVEHFVDGVPWEETSLFGYYRRLLDAGRTIDGCESIDELLDRYRKFDRMYRDIQENGYRSRDELCDDRRFRCLMNEVTVSIGRHGEFVLGGGGGWHRLSIAKLLSVEKIPVRVLLRHKEWHNKRKSILESGETKHRDLHPDLPTG